jgi:hypothetical protein
MNKKNKNKTKTKRRYKLKGGMFKSLSGKFFKPKSETVNKSETVMKCPNRTCESDNIVCDITNTECRCLECGRTDDYAEFKK